jgi:hypothetical protein
MPLPDELSPEHVASLDLIKASHVWSCTLLPQVPAAAAQAQSGLTANASTHTLAPSARRPAASDCRAPDMLLSAPRRAGRCCQGTATTILRQNPWLRATSHHLATHLLAARAGATTVLAGLIGRPAKPHVTAPAPTLGGATRRCARMGSGQCCQEVTAMVS